MPLPNSFEMNQDVRIKLAVRGNLKLNAAPPEKIFQPTEVVAKLRNIVNLKPTAVDFVKSALSQAARLQRPQQTRAANQSAHKKHNECFLADFKGRALRSVSNCGISFRPHRRLVC